MKLHLAMIFAKDMNRMTSFYRDGLGLHLIEDESEEGWVVFDAEGTRVALHAIPPAIADNIELEDPPRAREKAAVKLFYQVSDLTAAREHLARHGAVMREPRSVRSCDGLDPEGNVFGIMTK
jgi:catechol 2,3-dioxygenase-like lactoylglutathione lyase family enzyme